MQPATKVPIRSMVVSRDVAGLLDAEFLELELELELPLPVTAVQTPKPVVEVTYALAEENRDAQTGLELADCS
jgi:hypothetical protein